MVYQGSLQLEKYLEEAEASVTLGRLGVPIQFKRVRSKADYDEYELVGKYKGAMSMTISEPNKDISITVEFSDTNLEQWTDDMIPKGKDTEDSTNQDKYWNAPFTKQVTAAVKKQFPGFKLDIGG